MISTKSCLGGVLLCALLLVSSSLGSPAAERTVGLLQYDEDLSFDGYTLLAPQQSTTYHLIDNWGRIVHTWEVDVVASSAIYLLPDGDLLRGAKSVDSSGSIGRTIQRIAWDGTVEWSFDFTSDDHVQHHDIAPLPNGNVLLLVKKHYTAAEAYAAGRDTTLLTTSTISPETVVEIQPTGATTGDIVWEWNAWDHLIQDYDSTAPNYGVVADHPELFDLNFVYVTTRDWMHANAVNYNEELDQVVISSRHFNELWVVDHSTTTAEAAGHTGGHYGMGGDVLYRWGNPQTYDRGTGDDKILFGPHDIQWIEPGLPGEGNILLFNNGWLRPGIKYSCISEVVTPIQGDGSYPQPGPDSAHGPAGPVWSYVADTPSDFYSAKISGTQRLPNGNTLICHGDQGWFFEVTTDGEIVWQYQNPISGLGPLDQGDELTGSENVFRCWRYAPDYVGLAGHDLDPAEPVEGYAVAIAGTEHMPSDPSYEDTVVVTARVWADSGLSSVELYVNTGSGFVASAMNDDGLEADKVAGDSIWSVAIPPVVGGTKVGFYVRAEDNLPEERLDPSIAPDGAVYHFLVGHDYLCADIDLDQQGPDIADLVYLVTYMFQNGPEPPAPVTADINGDGVGPDIADLVYLVTYMFQTGPAPDCGF